MSDQPLPVETSEGVLVRVEFVEPPRPVAVAEISAALYDFNLLYEVAVMAVSPADSSKASAASRGGPWFWTRNALRVQRDERLQVREIHHQSPLLLLAAIPAAVVTMGGGLWAVVQAWERIVDRPVNREIKRAELAKAQSDAELSRYSAAQAKLDSATLFGTVGLRRLRGGFVVALNAAQSGRRRSTWSRPHRWCKSLRES